jgi:hypothetical protein
MPPGLVESGRDSGKSSRRRVPPRVRGFVVPIWGFAPTLAIQELPAHARFINALDSTRGGVKDPRRWTPHRGRRTGGPSLPFRQPPSTTDVFRGDLVGGGCTTRRLPHHRDAVGPEGFIEGDNARIFSESLGYEHAVERVAVMTRQGLDSGGVLKRDR